MAENDQQSDGLAAAEPKRFDMQTGIALTYDIKAPKMLMYLLTEDRLDSLQTGSESLASTYFGAFLGIALTAAGIAITLYYGAAPLGLLFAVCVLATVVCTIIAAYFGRIGWQNREACKLKFQDIKQNSATIVTLTPKQSD